MLREEVRRMLAAEAAEEKLKREEELIKEEEISLFAMIVTTERIFI